MNYSGAATTGRARAKETGSQELAGVDSDDRNWRGIVIALLVIILICGLVVVAIILVTPKNVEEDLGYPFTLEDVFNPDFKVRKLEATWIEGGDDDAFVYRDSTDGHVYEFNARQNVSRLVVEDDVFKTIGSDRYWVSPDLNYVLLAYDVRQVRERSFDAKYYIYHRHLPNPNLRLTAFPESSDSDWSDKRIQFAAWSPKGQALTFVYNNNIYFQENPLTSAIRLTNDGSEFIRNGVPNWLYEEEILNSARGHWLSDDHRFVAYIQLNDTTVPRVRLPVYGDPNDIYSRVVELPFPKAGDKNPGVIPVARLYIAETANAKASHRLLAPPTQLRGKDHYITSVHWRDNEHLLVTWSNRVQNQTVVTLCNVLSTDCHENLVEVAPDGRGWVSIDDVWFVHKGQQYLTVLNQRVGTSGHWKHVALVTSQTGSVGHRTFVTHGAWDVDKIVGVRETDGNDVTGHQSGLTVYFLGRSTNDGDPRERHLFRQTVELHRTRGPVRAETECLSCSRGPHCLFVDASFSKSADYYVEACLGPAVPSYTLRAVADNTFEWVLEDNKALKEKLAAKALPEKDFFKVQIDDDQYLWGQMYLPPGLNKEHITQYPLLLQASDGPDTQSVTHEFRLDWSTYLSTSHGVVYATVDARGSSGRGAHFRFANHRHLGKLEVEDHIATVGFLRNLHFVDKERIAVWGKSYGGFIVTHVLGEKHESVVHCGIALTPITDWRYHDTAYTERYMGLDSSADNYRAYDHANVSAKAEFFKGKQFLLIHGTADDRVHFQNSAQLMKALSEVGVLFDVLVYPDVNHRQSMSSIHLLNAMTNFLYKDCWGGVGPHDVVAAAAETNRKFIITMKAKA